MRILIPVDGSRFTKKSLGFVLNHLEWFQESKSSSVFLINVQGPIPPRVQRAVGGEVVKQYQESEALKVLLPIEKYLTSKNIPFSSRWVVGSPGQEIVKAIKKDKAQMVVMGSHGRGSLTSLVMGSVAREVLAGSSVPVLIVK